MGPSVTMGGMHRFTATNESEATVHAGRAQIWEALTDPELLPALTPFLTSIDAEGELWTWNMQKIPVLTTAISPSFTERMVFADKERIEFHHEPPEGRTERTGVNGWYQLSDHGPDATHLEISLTISVELPLSKRLSPAVTGTMKGVVGTMGRRFSHNLIRHLGAD